MTKITKSPLIIILIAINLTGCLKVLGPHDIPTTVTDIDGNTYNTVVIGTQAWFKEDLKTTKYNDGTPIPHVTRNAEWETLTSGAYSYYNNSGSTIEYGALYNWYTVDNNKATRMASNGGKNICPVGWHVPSDDEWTTLATYLGGKDIAGGKLKAEGTFYWAEPNKGATNETGFTALPGGIRIHDGTFNSRRLAGIWWSTTEYSSTTALRKVIVNNYTYLGGHDNPKQVGLSIRCIKD
ncbi:MAG: fibrobacter succinogenes major paralogous domain-containing protein [Bacteroidales bacterium]|jgi:uncharacterized protein (TIGR02145 family)|nr:fibrobacter succinogenes major paralogous domain-containing protein [Bacteroidales bacterium]